MEARDDSRKRTRESCKLLLLLSFSLPVCWDGTEISLLRGPHDHQGPTMAGWRGALVNREGNNEGHKAELHVNTIQGTMSRKQPSATG